MVFAPILLGAARRARGPRDRESTPLTCLRTSLTSVLLPEPEGAEIIKRIPATFSLSSREAWNAIVPVQMPPAVVTLLEAFATFKAVPVETAASAPRAQESCAANWLDASRAERQNQIAFPGMGYNRCYGIGEFRREFGPTGLRFCWPDAPR